ncbi:MAG: methyltransferase [Pseudomonadales bacterium]|nr:methyltransferase [Pseudomonadales bacterium]
MNKQSPNRKSQQEQQFLSPFGEFKLTRYPQENDPTLRAWSAADELLLGYVRENELLTNSDSNTSLVIANDNFGALSTCLAEFSPSLWSDSYISSQALAFNLKQNPSTAPEKVAFIPSTAALPNSVDLTLMQLPKNHHYLAYQLALLTQQLKNDGLVIAGVMVKHFHKNVLELFEKYVGPTHTTLAKKKARLIIAKKANHAVPFPSTINNKLKLEDFASQYPLERDDLKLVTLPNVFSRDKLDIGTRELLPHIPKDPSLISILDLGCGNGALGLLAAKLNPNAKVYFCDESYLAIESAKLTIKQAGLEQQCEFLVTDTTDGAPSNLDLILCNPPFHQQSSVHTQIAKRMFKKSHQHLKPGGHLLVVANRHLSYENALKRCFNTVNKISASKKFIILRAIK